MKKLLLFLVLAVCLSAQEIVNGGGTVLGDTVIINNITTEVVDVEPVDEDPACDADDYKIFKGPAEAKLKKCENGTKSDLGGASLTDQFQPITRWVNPDLLGDVFPDIALNVFEAEQTLATHDSLFRFAPETTANPPIGEAGAVRSYIDSRVHVRSDFTENITLKAWYSSETASGNYRFNAYFKSVGDGDSIVLPEMLTDGTFTACTDWDLTGDFDCSGGNLTYAHSSGEGTATLPSADFASAAKANMYYNCGYTTTEVAGGGPSCTITSAFALSAHTLSVAANATTYDQFVSAAAPGDFVISCTSGASDVITFDNMTCRPVFDQVVQLTTAVPGTAHLVDVIEFTPGTALVGGEMLTVRFELDYISAANTADGILNLWEVGLEGDQ